MIAEVVGMVPDELIGDLGDTHIYMNHMDAVNEQLSRNGYDEFIPKKEKSAIMQWYIKAQKDPSMYEPYLIKEQPTLASQSPRTRKFALRT